MRESKEGQTDRLSQKTNFIHSEVHEIPNSNLNLLLEGTLSAFLTSNYHKTGDSPTHSYDHSSQAPNPSNLQLREKMPRLNNEPCQWMSYNYNPFSTKYKQNISL